MLISRFKPRYWTADFNSGMVGSVITTDVDALRGTFLMRRPSDLGALKWSSFDAYDHADLSYETDTDYSGVVLSFHWESSNVVPIDQFQAPTLTLYGRDTNGDPDTWVVRLSNYITSGTAEDCDITLDFDDLWAGWDETSVDWRKVYPNDIDRMDITVTGYAPRTIQSITRNSNVVTVVTTTDHGLVTNQPVGIWGVTGGATWFNGTFTVASTPTTTSFTYSETGTNDTASTGMAYALWSGSELPPFPEEIHATIDLTNVTVTGTNARITLTWKPQSGSYVGLCQSYGDQYNLTPERVVENTYANGFRGWIDHYVGMNWFQNASWDAGESRFIIDTAKDPLTAPVSAWHEDFYDRCHAKGYKVVTSVSFELISTTCPLEWAQRDKDDNIGQTGYTPPSYLISPCHSDATDYIADVTVAFATLAVSAGLIPYVQIGEPWWWYGGGIGGNVPCFYDAATRAAYAVDFPGSPVMHEFATITDDTTGHETLIAWLRDKLGDALFAIRDRIKDALPRASVSALPYVPGILTPTLGMMCTANWPEEYYTYPNFDFFMMEDYEWVFNGEWELHEQALSIPLSTLGYPERLVHYFVSGPQYLQATGLSWSGTTVTVTSMFALTGWISVDVADEIELTHCDIPELNGIWTVTAIDDDDHLWFQFEHTSSGDATGSSGMFTNWMTAWPNSATAFENARARGLTAIYLWAYPQAMYGNYRVPVLESVERHAYRTNSPALISAPTRFRYRGQRERLKWNDAIDGLEASTEELRRCVIGLQSQHDKLVNTLALFTSLTPQIAARMERTYLARRTY